MISKLSNNYKRKFWSAEKYAQFIGVRIGTGCNIQNRKFELEPYLIEIGSRVKITSRTKFFTHVGAHGF